MDGEIAVKKGKASYGKPLSGMAPLWGRFGVLFRDRRAGAIMDMQGRAR